ncbi:hypothetical protein PIB30_092588 [Stylosanthes scabra]|uniref:Uncharacterized protein n=1 Tax=Stylosanthes scabra TaxID=79078 RepID=A0ABU6WUV0_9FABA|nr:hypothetical protein [Stylosanthes scabra]
MREELSPKAAILPEKFAPDLSWYVDVILQFTYKAMKGVLKFEEKKRFLEVNLMQGYKNGEASGIFAICRSKLETILTNLPYMKQWSAHIYLESLGNL